MRSSFPLDARKHKRNKKGNAAVQPQAQIRKGASVQGGVLGMGSTNTAGSLGQKLDFELQIRTSKVGYRKS